MISNDNLTEEWLEQKRVELSCDPILLEKAIKALQLLELLVIEGVDLVFKGGTSMILLLQKFRRLSIDVDIVVKPKTKLNSAFQRIIESDSFTNFVEDKRNHHVDYPVKHYKFFYSPVNKSQKNAYVLLDILFEEVLYSELVEVKIENPIFMSSEPIISVKVPSIDALLGDKLTAFAPNTIGIPYGKGKEMEIVKQLFDIATLFEYYKNLHTVKSTFNRIALAEISYRKQKDLTTDEVLHDVFRTTIIIGARGKIQSERYKELDTGRSKVSSHIIGNSYSQNKFYIDASKTAYLSASLLTGINEKINLNLEENLKGQIISISSFNSLNKLKKISPEAFFYFKKAIELLEEQEDNTWTSKNSKFGNQLWT